jgi:hypothetical protein
MPSTVITNTNSDENTFGITTTSNHCTSNQIIASDTIPNEEIDTIPMTLTTTATSVKKLCQSPKIKKMKQQTLDFKTLKSMSKDQSSINDMYVHKDTTINLQFRDYVMNKDEKSRVVGNYVRQFGIYLSKNFNVKRRKNKLSSNTTSRRSNRHKEIIDSIRSVADNSLNALDGFMRCYVEDFMGLRAGDVIRVLVPIKSGFMTECIPTEQIEFGTMKYNIHSCIVSTSPYSDRLRHGGLPMSDVKKGFGDGGYGLYVKLDTSCTRSDDVSIPQFVWQMEWSKVLLGKRREFRCGERV